MVSSNLAKAPKFANLVTMAETTSPTEYRSSIVSHGLGDNLLKLSAILSASLSTFNM